MADGDGWVDNCTCGERHWGIHGAAGLLVVSDYWVLLHQRSPGSHHGGTWSIPGGALRGTETAEQAAVREAVEEVGVDPARLDLVGSHVDDHGAWSYTTVLATHQGGGEMRPVAETTAVEWVFSGMMNRYPLHPRFRAVWEGHLAGRVFSLGLTTQQVLTEVPAGAPLVGWRAWSGRNGVLRDGSGHTAVWDAGPQQAVCGRYGVRRADHVAPDVGCECGIRLVEDLPTLLRFLALASGSIAVVTVPDVIGLVAGWGTVAPGVNDPPGTWRVQTAQVLDRLYVAPHMAPYADQLARLHSCKVIVGTGAGWVDDLADAETPNRAGPLRRPTRGLDDGEVVGWRSWLVADDGALVHGTMPYTWPPKGGGHAKALCPVVGLRHDTPDAHCTCGFRLVDTLGRLLGFLRADGHRFHRRVSDVGDDYVADREYWGVQATPDVVGTARGWGYCLDVKREPGTWRVEHAEAGGRLHLSPHVWWVAEWLADQQHARVVVGSRLGAEWLDEIADYEAGTPAQGQGVTWLAPAGSVNPRWFDDGRPAPTVAAHRGRARAAR